MDAKPSTSGVERNNYFASGVTVKGIPYSQTPYQKDKAGFVNSMSSSDFIQHIIMEIQVCQDMRMIVQVFYLLRGK